MNQRSLFCRMGIFFLTLLTAVGGELEEFNISMGYPLKRSALYTLIDLGDGGPEPAQRALVLYKRLSFPVAASFGQEFGFGVNQGLCACW